MYCIYFGKSHFNKEFEFGMWADMKYESPLHISKKWELTQENVRTYNKK
jgi:hypothetical protein